MNTTTNAKRRQGRPRRRRVVAVLAAIFTAVSTVVMLAPAASAAAAPSTYEVDVVNHAGTDVKVRFFYGPGTHQGDISSADLGPDFGNARALPTAEAVTLGPAAKSVTYGYQVPAQSFDNGYWIEITRGDDPHDRTVAKAYRWDPATPPPGITEQAGTSLVVSSRYEPRSVNFSGDKTRIVITEPRTSPDLPYGDPSWPYQGPWDRDIRIGQDNGGWTQVDATTQLWRLTGLPRTSDYWLRCYDKRLVGLLFNGYSPTTAQLGGGSTDGKPDGFWVTSDQDGVITVLRPAAAAAPNNAGCDVHRSMTTVDATRITGSSTTRAVNERPIYKMEIQASTRSFSSALPNQFRIPPYTVEGKDSSGIWRQVGIALPTPAVRIQGQAIEYGGATFYFQNKAGGTITHLRVSGGYTGASDEIFLSQLAMPTTSMTDISDLMVTPQQGSGIMSVEANGVARQGLDVKLFDQSGDLLTSGPLADAYASVYFRDEDGRLITGLYAPDGSNMVSGVDGDRRAQFSSTDSTTGLTWITPNLDLDDHLDAGDLRATLVGPQHRLYGTIFAGVSIARGTATVPVAATPADAPPIYRVLATGADAVEEPATVAVLAYHALVASTELPRTNIQSDGLAVMPMAVQAGTLKLAPGADPGRIGNLARLNLSVVSVHGTAVGPYSAGL